MIPKKPKILFVYSDRFCSCTHKRCFEIINGLWRYQKDSVEVDAIQHDKLLQSHFEYYDILLFQRLGANGTILEDSFSKFVRENKLGKVVADGDVQGWADSIIELVDDKKQYQACKDNIASFAKKYTWKETTSALIETIHFLDSLPPKTNRTWYRLAYVRAKHKSIYIKQLTFKRVFNKLWKMSIAIPLSMLNRNRRQSQSS